MKMLGLNGAIDQLAMTNSVHWYGVVEDVQLCIEKGIRFRN